MSEPALRVSGLAKAGVLDGVGFEVRGRELVSLLGPSGAGKTSILRLIAGLDRPDAGEIELAGRVVSAPARGVFLPPQARDIGMVFQSFALWPHLTVFENLAFPLRVRAAEESRVRAKVGETLAALRLEGLEGRLPSQLSGGQRQRVALGRALIYDAKLILLDEPLANVDPPSRERIGAELRQTLRAAGATVLLVTHDQHEALALSDRIVLLERGRLVQQGSAEELYRRPAHRFTAEFFGASNALTGVYRKGTGSGLLELCGRTLAWDGEALPDRAPVSAYARYGDFTVSRAVDAPGWDGVVEDVSFAWDRERAVIALDGARLIVELERGAVKRGDAVKVDVPPSRLHVFPQELPPSCG